MDYEGSFIYDQYPDKLTMRRMVDSVMAVIKNNEDAGKAAPVQRDVMLPQMMPENAVQNISEQDVAVSNMADRMPPRGCLLYTSDAADDRISVDLGGRRIIKKIFFKQKTAYEIRLSLVGSEMCIRDRCHGV